MAYTRIENLSVLDYMYPDEDTAFNQVRRVPHLDKLIGKLVGTMSNVSHLPKKEASLYRVTQETCPKLHALYELAKARLDIHQDIPLFIQPEFDFNAYSVGGDSPFIVINSSFVKNCPDEVLLFILGHELGHNKGNHVVYQTLVRLLLSEVLAGGQGALLQIGATAALYDWARKQEYSADRAGAIAAGGTEYAIQGLQTLLGAYDRVKGVQVSREDVLMQIEEYEEENENAISKLIMLGMICMMNHPWTVNRIGEMQKWKDSGEFDALIQKKAAD